MINWELWHSAFELAQSGSYKAASKRLNVNPTTIKRRREALEKMLDRRLFFREEGRLVPTPAFQDIISELAAASIHLRSARLGMAPELEIGAWRNVTITSVPYICDQLLARRMAALPGYKRLRIQLVGSDRNLEIGKTGDADIALRLGPSPSKDVSNYHIANLPYSTYIHRDSMSQELPWATLDRSYSQLQEVRLSEEHAGADGVAYTASTMFSLQGLIDGGVAKGLLPDFLGNKCDNLVALNDHPKIVRPLWLMWDVEAIKEPHIKSVLVWIIREVCQPLSSTEEANELLGRFGR